MKHHGAKCKYLCCRAHPRRDFKSRFDHEPIEFGFEKRHSRAIIHGQQGKIRPRKVLQINGKSSDLSSQHSLLTISNLALQYRTTLFDHDSSMRKIQYLLNDGTNCEHSKPLSKRTLQAYSRDKKLGDYYLHLSSSHF